jgi:CubicO group peptidase (beta-lactamase class C family)
MLMGDRHLARLLAGIVLLQSLVLTPDGIGRTVQDVRIAAGVSRGEETRRTLGIEVAESRRQLSSRSPATLEELDRMLSDIATSKRLPGFGAAVVTGDRVLFRKGYGFADIDNQLAYTPQSLHYIASVSKTLIGISLMQLVEQRRIRLDDDINLYLPFKILNPHFPTDVITIRHLATHTSTIRDRINFYYDKDYLLDEKRVPRKGDLSPEYEQRLKVYGANKRMPMDQFVRNFVAKDGAWYSKNTFLKQRPGTTMEYSNLGATIAGLIVERVAGETYAEYTRKQILAPLGMSDSGWSFDKIDLNRFVRLYVLDAAVFPRYSSIGYPESGLITSLDDMTKYLMEMIKGYQGRSGLLGQELFREMVSAQSKVVRLGGIFWNVQDACDSQVSCIGHGGADYGAISHIGFNPKTNIGIMLFTNYSSPNYFRDDVPAARAFHSARQALTDYARQNAGTN